jgi:hypothetical protein
MWIVCSSRLKIFFFNDCVAELSSVPAGSAAAGQGSTGARSRLGRGPWRTAARRGVSSRASLDDEGPLAPTDEERDSNQRADRADRSPWRRSGF